MDCYSRGHRILIRNIGRDIRLLEYEDRRGKNLQYADPAREHNPPCGHIRYYFFDIYFMYRWYFEARFSGLDL